MVSVSSPPPAAPSTGRPHPTYKEMIVEALTELRDPGLSRRAIAMYIADHFSGLHSSHEALLDVHLRRLISQGQLRLVSGNYFLSTEAPPQKRGPGRPRKNADLAPSSPIPISQSPKRGRGRPRKNTPVPVASSASPLLGEIASSTPSGVKRGRGRPRKNALVPVASSASPLLGTIAASPLSGVKRGRGRPRKSALVPVDSSAPPLLGAIASPPPSGVKRGPGRPRKKNVLVPMASSALPLLGTIAASPLSGVKRGRGRPRKSALVPVASSAPLLPLAIVPPPPSEFKRGRGRPRKNALVLLASTALPLLGAIAPSPASGVKRGRGRPRKNTLALVPRVISQLPPSGVKRGRGRPRNNSYPGASSFFKRVVGAKGRQGHPPKVVVAGKRKRGRPRKENVQSESVQSMDADAPLIKRGRGRPRKEKALESGHLKAAQMTEGQNEALPAQAVDQSGAVQNEVEARSLQSFGTLTEKRGRGRPRKRPLEVETAETGAAVLVEKRGRGRPRKEHPSAGRSTETGLTSSLGIKRGPGRPRKARPFESGFAETAVEVSTDLTGWKPEKDEDLASGKKTEIQGVILVEEMDARHIDAGYVLVSGEGAAIAPMDAGGAMPGVMAGEEAAITPTDASAATRGVDPMDSNMGTKRQ